MCGYAREPATVPRTRSPMNNKHVEGAMRCFLDAPDLVVVLNGKVVRGPAALRQALADLFSSMRTVHVEIDGLYHWSAGNTVFAAGTAVYHSDAQDGRNSTLKEYWTNARQTVRGRWVYVLSHAARFP